MEALELHTPEQIEAIKAQLSEGGVKKKWGKLSVKLWYVNFNCLQ
jgi:hypothetical protein